jgi:hypothetical protein
VGHLGKSGWNGYIGGQEPAMTKPFDWDAVDRAMRESPQVAKSGTPEQKAGMFKPSRPQPPAGAKAKRSAA